MKDAKEVVIGLTIVLSILLIMSVVTIKKSLDVSLSPASFHEPVNCSESEIRGTWDSVFQTGSLGITIITDNDISEGRCEAYIAYKTGTEINILTGMVKTESVGKSIRIYGFQADTTPAFF